MASDARKMSEARNPILRRWEALPGVAQFAIAFPIWFLVFWVGHVKLLNQPRLPARFPLRPLLGAAVLAAHAARDAQRAGEALPARAPRGAGRSLTTAASCSRCSTPRDGRSAVRPARPATRDPSLIHPSVARRRGDARRLLWQLRGYGKDSAPGHWDHACSGSRRPRRGRARGARCASSPRRSASRSSRGARADRPRALRARQRDRADDGLPARSTTGRSRCSCPSWRAWRSCRAASVPIRCRPPRSCSARGSTPSTPAGTPRARACG